MVLKTSNNTNLWKSRQQTPIAWQRYIDIKVIARGNNHSTEFSVCLFYMYRSCNACVNIYIYMCSKSHASFQFLPRHSPLPFPIWVAFYRQQILNPRRTSSSRQTTTNPGRKHWRDRNERGGNCSSRCTTKGRANVSTAVTQWQALCSVQWGGYSLGAHFKEVQTHHSRLVSDFRELHLSARIIVSKRHQTMMGTWKVRMAD